MIENLSAEESNELAFNIFENEFKIPQVVSPEESTTLENTDIKIWLHYLEQICEIFRGEIPHVKHPKLDYAEFKQKNQNTNTMADFAKLHRIAAAKREALNKDDNGASSSKKFNKLPTSPPPQNDYHRRGRKRRSHEKHANIVSLINLFLIFIYFHIIQFLFKFLIFQKTLGLKIYTLFQNSFLMLINSIIILFIFSIIFF